MHVQPYQIDPFQLPLEVFFEDLPGERCQVKIQRAGPGDNGKPHETRLEVSGQIDCAANIHGDGNAGDITPTVQAIKFISRESAEHDGPSREHDVSMPQNEIKRGRGYGNNNIDVLLGILGTVKIGKAPLLGSFSSERQIQDVAQQNDILSGGFIEYGFHPIVDCSMRRGGPAFRLEQGQNFFGTRRLIGVGL